MFGCKETEKRQVFQGPFRRKGPTELGLGDGISVCGGDRFQPGEQQFYLFGLLLGLVFRFARIVGQIEQLDSLLASAP